jgi:hypothetical protein
MSPTTYPPLFPVVLAPLVARYGIDYQVLEIPGILFFAATIPVLFCLAIRRLPLIRAFAVTAIWGASPLALWLKDSVLPDFLFLLLWLLTIFVLERSYENPQGSGTAKWAVVAGLLMFATYATRSAAIVAPPALLCYDLARYRRISRFGLFAAGVFGLLFLGQNLLIHSETSYVQMFTLALFKTARIYGATLTTVFTAVSTGWIRVARMTATVGLGLFGLWGFAAQVRRFRSPTEFILAAYFLLLLLWSPGAGGRYFMPLVPFLFIYMVVGLGELRDRGGRNFALPAEAALAVLILICYAAEYARYPSGPIPGGVSTPGFAELCRYIDAQTDARDVFIFENPRVLSLYTRRPAAVYPENGDPQLFWNFHQSAHARYLVATNFMDEDKKVIDSFLRRYGGYVRLTYGNENFRLYSFEN